MIPLMLEEPEEQHYPDEKPADKQADAVPCVALHLPPALHAQVQLHYHITSTN